MPTPVPEDAQQQPLACSGRAAASAHVLGTHVPLALPRDPLVHITQTCAPDAGTI
jgi:hypothetical protein